MILTHLVMFSFLNGASGAAEPVVITVFEQTTHTGLFVTGADLAGKFETDANVYPRHEYR